MISPVSGIGCASFAQSNCTPRKEFIPGLTAHTAPACCRVSSAGLHSLIRLRWPLRHV